MKKKLLLVMPKFHGYETSLLDQIKKDYEVDSYIYDSKMEFNINVFLRIIRKLNTLLIPIYKQHYLESIYYYSFNRKIRKVYHNNRYDVFFVVKGFGISDRNIRNVVATHKVLYQWDSIERFPTVTSKYRLFKKIYTFDYNDALKGYGTYLPNFIDNKEKNSISLESGNTFFFVGEFDSYRHCILKKIKNKCIAENIRFDFTLVKDNYDGNLEDFVSQSVVSKEAYRKRFQDAKFILELSKEDSHGYTQRFFEALHAGKIIIGNKNSMYSIEDFLSMNQSEVKNMHFKITEEQRLLLHTLRIDRWIKKVLDNEEN